MPTSIKVLPPERLTDGQLSEEEFQCYQTELEVFLELEAKFIPFLKGGNYETWEAGENDVENRLTVKAVETDDLAVKNRDLKLFLSMVAKTLPKSQYGTVMAHATQTSLKWYSTIAVLSGTLAPAGTLLKNNDTICPAD